MTDYRPIACSLHDRMESAVVLRTPVRLTWRSQDGVREEAGRIVDVVVRDGAEYLRMENAGEIRLDRIEVFEEVKTTGE